MSKPSSVRMATTSSTGTTAAPVTAEAQRGEVVGRARRGGRGATGRGWGARAGRVMRSAAIRRRTASTSKTGSGIDGGPGHERRRAGRPCSRRCGRRGSRSGSGRPRPAPRSATHVPKVRSDWAWVVTAPLGRPVVPEVKMKSERSAGGPTQARPWPRRSRRRPSSPAADEARRGRRRLAPAGPSPVRRLRRRTTTVSSGPTSSPASMAG